VTLVTHRAQVDSSAGDATWRGLLHRREGGRPQIIWLRVPCRACLCQDWVRILRAMWPIQRPKVPATFRAKGRGPRRGAPTRGASIRGVSTAIAIL